jgi:hypothetical protein
MKVEVFKDILSRIRKADAVVNVLYPMVDVTNVTDEYINVIEMMMKCYYGEDAAEWISSYLYDLRDPKNAWAWDKDGKEILKNEDELWAYCEELKMSKKDYEPEPLMTDEQRAELMEEMKKAFLQ